MFFQSLYFEIYKLQKNLIKDSIVYKIFLSPVTHLAFKINWIEAKIFSTAHQELKKISLSIIKYFLKLVDY